ncbi:hypothetical protein V8C86DRAFT_2449704 [Haematococcus lacustris]
MCRYSGFGRCKVHVGGTSRHQVYESTGRHANLTKKPLPHAKDRVGCHWTAATTTLAGAQRGQRHYTAPWHQALELDYALAGKGMSQRRLNAWCAAICTAGMLPARRTPLAAGRHWLQGCQKARDPWPLPWAVEPALPPHCPHPGQRWSWAERCAGAVHSPPHPDPCEPCDHTAAQGCCLLWRCFPHCCCGRCHCWSDDAGRLQSLGQSGCMMPHHCQHHHQQQHEAGPHCRHG